MLFPILAAGEFCSMFISPKLHEVWEMAGISKETATNETANLFLSIAGTLADSTFWLTLGSIVLIRLLESFVPNWWRVRNVVLDVIIFLAYTAMLGGLLLVASCALIAVPVALNQQ